MIFKCPYYVHILSNTKNAPRTFYIFFNKELYTILPKFLENSSKFCVKKKCNSPNFLQMRKSFCLNVLNTIMQLCTQDFCLNRIFQQVTFFFDILRIFCTKWQVLEICYEKYTMEMFPSRKLILFLRYT